MKHLSDDDLVAQAKLGNDQAFTELWSRHGEQTRHVIRRIIRNREDAEDILQEACLNRFCILCRSMANRNFPRGRIALPLTRGSCFRGGGRVILRFLSGNCKGIPLHWRWIFPTARRTFNWKASWSFSKRAGPPKKFRAGRVLEEANGFIQIWHRHSEMIDMLRGDDSLIRLCNFPLISNERQQAATDMLLLRAPYRAIPEGRSREAPGSSRGASHKAIQHPIQQQMRTGRISSRRPSTNMKKLSNRSAKISGCSSMT